MMTKQQATATPSRTKAAITTPSTEDAIPTRFRVGDRVIISTCYASTDPVDPAEERIIGCYATVNDPENAAGYIVAIVDLPSPAYNRYHFTHDELRLIDDH